MSLGWCKLSNTFAARGLVRALVYDVSCGRGLVLEMQYDVFLVGVDWCARCNMMCLLGVDWSVSIQRFD